MTSLEIAIIVAIVLIIAVAVGWYVYTTFIASTGNQPRLNIVSAEIVGTELKLVLVNPGPVDVELSSFEVAGSPTSWPPTCNLLSGPPTSIPVIKVGSRVQCTATLGSGTGTVTPGTMLPGRVVLSGGQSFPFNALVKPGT
jgi:hypothetical protein